MAKKNKRDKQEPNFVCFLVEGESDQLALELPLSELILEKHPKYEIRFLLQEKRIIQNEEGLEDTASTEEEEELEDYDSGHENADSYDDDDYAGEDEDEYLPEPEYIYGGDITSDWNVRPDNIETKITNRFIKPLTIGEGVYPKKIARIIQILDLDGVYIPDENVVGYSPEHYGMEDPYYDAEKGRIETKDVQSIIDRNARKRENIAYLLGLNGQKISIGPKKIPYEIYFFSTNLEHFTKNDANVTSGKNHLADQFRRKYGIDKRTFCRCFLNDPDAIGHLGYRESWERAQQGTESLKRHTNIDCLIRKLTEED